MKLLPKLLLGCLAAAGFSCPAFAQVTLSLSPITDTIGIGAQETFNLNISGLKSSADYNGPALGGYTVQVDYNSLTAAAESVSFGSLLSSSGPDYQFSDLTTPGQIYLTETSYDTPAQLEANQTASFTLATFTMQGLSAGTTPLTIDLAQTSLTDGNGNTLDLAKTTNASLTAIPEPSVTASVLGALAMGACALRRKFAQTLGCA